MKTATTRSETATGRTRMQRGILTGELIVEMSLQLLDASGVAGFSLPKLGRALGADPTAVYRYFQSKDDLVLAIADRLIEEAIEGFQPHECWIETVAELARRIRAVYREHPAAASLSAFRTTRRPAEMQAVDWLTGAMLAAGFEGEQAALSYRTIADFSLYLAGGEAKFLSLEPAEREADAGAWARAYRAVDPQEYPNISSLRDALPLVTEDAIYEQALAFFLGGLHAAAPAGCPCAPGTHSVAGI
jgi:AcrR family transcriptional regulator